MNMIERVADRLEQRFKDAVAKSAGMDFENTGVSLPGRAVWIEYATAAIEAIFSGSRMIEYRGTIVVANPEFQPHYWDGTKMIEITDLTQEPTP